MKRNDDTGFAELVASPRILFYHDLPVDEGNYWVSELTPHSMKSLSEGGEFAYAGWQDVPSWFIGTLEDKAFPVMVSFQGIRYQFGCSVSTSIEVDVEKVCSDSTNPC